LAELTDTTGLSTIVAERHWEGLHWSVRRQAVLSSSLSGQSAWRKHSQYISQHAHRPVPVGGSGAVLTLNPPVVAAGAEEGTELASEVGEGAKLASDGTAWSEGEARLPKRPEKGKGPVAAVAVGEATEGVGVVSEFRGVMGSEVFVVVSGDGNGSESFPDSLLVLLTEGVMVGGSVVFAIDGAVALATMEEEVLVTLTVG